MCYNIRMSEDNSTTRFRIESDRAFIVLGNSERREFGEYIGRALDAMRIFEDIDVFTLNHSAAMLGRASIRKAMETRTVITHSAGILRIPKALQIVAINPPEPVPLGQLIKRAVFEVTKDSIDAEAGAPKTGTSDMLKAGLELARGPISTIVTAQRIARGYSATRRLIEGAEDFPAGRAMVHSELDAFGFAGLADSDRAARAGVTTIMLPGHYHNEMLFAPRRTFNQLTPEIFPNPPE